jgi:hypothetical protein
MAESAAQADARRASVLLERRADGALVIRPGDIAAKTYDLWQAHLKWLRVSHVGSLRPDLLLFLDELSAASSADGTTDMHPTKIEGGKSGSDAVVFLSTAQVAGQLGISPRAVTKLLAAGRLSGRKEDRQWFVTQTDLDEYTGEA